MKSKYWLLIVISTAFIFLSVSATKNQNPQWKGTIEEEDGVKVIKNPNDPLFGEITLDLEEDLSIGNEEDENYIFYRGIQLAVDSTGNIFALDLENERIQKYDKDGNYLLTIGRKGQGPGEFQSPILMSLDSEENIYIRDGIKLIIFDKEGRYKREIILSKAILVQWGITKEGNILGQIKEWQRDAARKGKMKGSDNVILINSKGENIKTIARYPFEYSLIFGGWASKTPFDDTLRSNLISSQLWIYGYSSEYKLYLIDSSGELVCIIEKNEPPASIAKKEKDEYIDGLLKRQNQTPGGEKYPRGKIESSIKFPKYKPFFTNLFSDDKERIYVRQFQNPSSNSDGAEYDIFSREGYFLYGLKLSVRIDTIKNGYLYRVERDEETGYSKIKRYKIKNWKQIKEGVQ